MRYYIFLFWYHQWFRNHDGIKGFAQQCMNWILRSTLRLAERLKKKNKQMTERIKELSAALKERMAHPVVEADDFPSVKSKVRGCQMIILICIIGETYFNFFAAKAIFNFEGYFALTAQIMFALLISLLALIVFENFFSQLLLLKPYKAERKEERHWGKLVTLSGLVILYEWATYYFCKIRGMQIEGGDGDGIIGTAMIIIGMLIPIVAGYYKYERSRFIDAYKNTVRIEWLKKTIAKKTNNIKVNEQRMETHFKQKCEEEWAFLQEFATYKENYNRRKNIRQEDLKGHFCESQEHFIREAIARYKKQAIQVEPALVVQEADGEVVEGVQVEIKEMFATNN